MAQYKTGTVNVTNGSNVITGNGTSFFANISAGDAFKIKGLATIYIVETVSAVAEEFTISVNYGGVSGNNLEYQIARDFTDFLGLMEVSGSDADWPEHLTNGVIRKLDQLLATALGNDLNYAATIAAALALKAPLVSPALTGVPTAPTAAPGTNTTQISTTAFVQAAIASLIASAPGALDTLNELAAALGNDANFATTITNALALKAPLANPTFTTNVTSPKFTSTVATGTAPVAVSSTTRCTNLNVDMLDGFHASQSGAASCAVVTDANSNAFLKGLSFNGPYSFGLPDADGKGTIAPYSTAYGLTLVGRGSTNDIVLMNKNGSTALSVPTGTADVCIGGTLYAGVTNGSYHVLYKNVAAGTTILGLQGAGAGNGGFHHMFLEGDNTGWNGASTCYLIGKVTSSGRSISAAGTVSTSGTDYAEYERKSETCADVAKGQVIGYDHNGCLTDKWAEAFSFGVKTTNPSFVGGDGWGGEEIVGKRPEEPVFVGPEYAGVSDPGPAPVAPVFVLPEPPVQQPSESDETFSMRQAAYEQQCEQFQADIAAAATKYREVHAEWQLAVDTFEVDQQIYSQVVETAKEEHKAAMSQYAVDLQKFEALLEVERQKVDRVAYSGKVPCNTEPGAFVGGYVVAVEGPDGSIAGKIITKEQMRADMSQYLDAVGRIRRVLADGRPEIAVIVH